MEIQYDDLVQTIFSKQPDNPKSVTLDFVEKLELKELFEFLLSFFTDGCKILYGELENNIVRVNLNKLNESKVNNLKSYLASIGFELKIEIEPVNFMKDYNSMMYKNVNVSDQTKLSELKMVLRNLNNIYIISFEFLR